MVESMLYLFNIHYRSLTEGQTENFTLPLWATCLIQILFWSIGVAVQIFFTKKERREEMNKSGSKLMGDNVKNNMGSITELNSNIERSYNMGEVHYDARDLNMTHGHMTNRSYNNSTVLPDNSVYRSNYPRDDRNDMSNSKINETVILDQSMAKKVSDSNNEL